MTDEPAVDLEEFDSLVEQAESGIEYAVEKLESGRIKDTEREDLRIDYLGQLHYLLDLKLDILEAKQAEEDNIRTRAVARDAVESRFDIFEDKLMERIKKVWDDD